MSHAIHIGDCLEVLRGIPSNTFGGSLTDPPYGLNFMGKQWDKGVPSSTVWSEVLRVLKPGGHLLAFGGARTFHRLTCAIEDAGFEIRDCLMWLYGTGFPKSHDMSKALDKAAAATPEDAKRFSGYGTALKPAWEPCIVAMKPVEGTFAANALAHGVAGLNIDGSRIGSDIVGWSGNPSDGYSGGLNNTETPRLVAGRWPANLVLDESFTQDWSRFFYCAKASTAERDAGLSGVQISEKPGCYRDGFLGKKTEPRRNNHPCVKPIELNRYLANLILPPPSNAARRLLVPFSGSGSEMIGGLLSGWDHAEGIEREAEYVNMAHERIKHWTNAKS